MDQKITILVTDDHPIAREGVRAVLEKAADMKIVGEAHDGVEALTLVASLHPQVLLLDLKMPGMRAWEVEKWVRKNYPEVVTLVLTAHDRDFYLSEMMNAGAVGLLDKSERGEKLLDAIRRAVKGETLYTPEQYERVLNWRGTTGKTWNSLTEREREIAHLLVRGLDDASLARELSIAPRTASFHVANLLKKLGVNSRQEAMAWLIKHIPEMSDDL